jgi:hypothetical protein
VACFESTIFFVEKVRKAVQVSRIARLTPEILAGDIQKAKYDG